jgi:isopentenyl diphosphate isomerase/L-lactate dehydrogenase-like FMN-dependent dehydrogenase
MSDGEELQQRVVEWFQKHSKEGKTKFYVKDVVKGLSSEYEKRAIQKAIQDCTEAGTVMYWSSGSTTMLVLPENFPKSVT